MLQDLIIKIAALDLDMEESDSPVQRDPIVFAAANDDFREARLRCAVACEKFNALSESASREDKENAYLKIIGLSQCHAMANPSRGTEWGHYSLPQKAPYIKAPFFVDYGCRLQIGTSTFINRGCKILDTPCADVKIGEACQLGPDVHIYCVGHPVDWRVRLGHRPLEFSKEDAAVRFEQEECAKKYRNGPSFAKGLIIEDAVWIGGGAIILGGIHIGKGAVIGAGSVVTKDVPAGHKVVGNPARIVNKIANHVDSSYPMVQAKNPSEWVATMEAALRLG